MARDPMKRFLGLPSTAQPHELLGVSGPDASRADIEAALRKRLDRIYRHPAGREPEADDARNMLRAAAERLLKTRHPSAPASRPPQAAKRAPEVRRTAPAKPAQHELTEFDRQALAILVGCGGWNRRSRALLVALAAAYGLSAAGLLRVVRGLSQYARAGGPHVEVSAITAGATRMDSPLVRISPSADLLLPDPTDRGSSLGMTVGLSAGAGCLVVIAFVALLLRVLMPAAPETVPSTLPDPAPIAAEVEPDVATEPEPAPEPMRRARFERIPTFTATARPLAAIDAADAAPDLVTALNELARRLEVTDAPAETRLQMEWRDIVNGISAGWGLLDGSMRAELDTGVQIVLMRAGDRSVVASILVGELEPPRAPATALEVWQGAWKAGTISTITSSRVLPPIMRSLAADRLEAIVREESTGATTFNAGAARWLRGLLPLLIESAAYDEIVLDRWEAWLAAARALGVEEEESLLLAAVEAIVESSYDLEATSARQDVLGRILAALDYEGSPAVRRAMLAWYASEDESITPVDLWIITSLLSRLDVEWWRDESLVMLPDASRATRRRLRDRLAQRWPDPALQVDQASGRAIIVDAAQLTAWKQLLANAEAIPMEELDDLALMRVLYAVVKLNESAALLALHDRSVSRLLESIGSTLEARTEPIGPARAPRPEKDGVLATALRAAGRDADDQVRAIDSLRLGTAADLGPLDAEALVNRALDGSSRGVRDAARQLITARFRIGPNVLLELHDQLALHTPDRDGVTFIEELLGVSVPADNGVNRELALRAALVEAVIELRASALTEIDRLAGEIATALVARAGLVDSGSRRGGRVDSLDEAAGQLLEAWRTRADRIVSARPFPAGLEDLERRARTRSSIANGPAQQLVANQLAVLDLHAYVATGERASLRDDVARTLAASFDERREATRVLAQAIEVERAMARIWSLRLAGDDGEGGP